VAKAAFFILRVLIAIGALAVLAGTLAVFLLQNFIGLIKSGVGMIASVVTLFASGFRNSPEAPGPSVVISPVLLGLGITFSAMFVSVFLPGQRIFLHGLAVMALAAAGWDVWRATTTPNHEMLFLPLIVLWFVYYGLCLRRA